jgi:hypothetical protein
MNDALCMLCNEPAKKKETDCGNCSYFSCTNANCGNYEISNRAARELGGNMDRKESLRGIVSQAKQNGRAVDIFETWTKNAQNTVLCVPNSKCNRRLENQFSS